MLGTRIAPLLAALGALLAATATAYLLWLPEAVGHTRILFVDGRSVIETSSTSLVEEHGLGIVVILALPVAMALAGVAAARKAGPGGKVGLLVCAVFVALFSFVFVFTWGFFYAPAAVALLLATMVHAAFARPGGDPRQG